MLAYRDRKEYMKEYRIKWRANPVNREKARKYEREWSRKRLIDLRKRIFQKYGDKCLHCGFDDVRALQIDHVNGGGLKEFREKYQTGMSRSRRKYYKAVLEDTAGRYQLLCANCNWIKKHERNEV